MSSEVRMRRRAIATARMKLHTTDNEKCTTLAATKASQSKLTGGGKIVLPRRMAAASVVHFSLSVVCSFILAVAIARRRMRTSLLIGAVFGLLLYVVNMYGFTHLFPWFEIARDWITLVTHVAFGLAAAGVYTLLTDRARHRATGNAKASGA